MVLAVEKIMSEGWNPECLAVDARHDLAPTAHGGRSSAVMTTQGPSGVRCRPSFSAVSMCESALEVAHGRRREESRSRTVLERIGSGMCRPTLPMTMVSSHSSRAGSRNFGRITGAPAGNSEVGTRRKETRG